MRLKKTVEQFEGWIKSYLRAGGHNICACMVELDDWSTPLILSFPCPEDKSCNTMIRFEIETPEPGYIEIKSSIEKESITERQVVEPSTEDEDYLYELLLTLNPPKGGGPKSRPMEEKIRITNMWKQGNYT